MTDQPNDPFWEWVDQNLTPNPNERAVCYAIDTQGMRAVYTTRPYFHPASQRWTPTGNGQRVNIGLMQVDAGFDGSTTLVIRPGYEQQVQDQQPAAEQAVSGRAQRFAPNTIQPDQRGPDAQGQPEEVQTAEDLVQANLRAMGESRQLHDEPQPSPKQQKDQQALDRAAGQEALEQVVALIPERRMGRKKNQQLVQDLRERVRIGLTERDTPLLDELSNLVAPRKQVKIVNQMDKLLELAGL